MNQLIKIVKDFLTSIGLQPKNPDLVNDASERRVFLPSQKDSCRLVTSFIDQEPVKKYIFGLEKLNFFSFYTTR
jgi:hypothetical protein